MAATTNWPKRDIGHAKPEMLAVKQTAPPVELRDAGIRLILIPVFGIVIPNLTGLFGQVQPGDSLYWFGYVWFIALSFSVWHGNRYFLLLQRRRFDWMRHRSRKVVLLLAANVFYTAPVTVAMLLSWYWAAGSSPKWTVIQTVTLMNVICVIFITHTYETVFLIQQRESDVLAVEKLERARTQAQLEALKSQIDPHFLFNSLNTLSALIARNPALAIRFNEDLADVYRYILCSKERDLVLLEDELDFLMRYFRLLEIRFGSAIRLDVRMEDLEGDRWLVPPISLQVLMENAAKHTEFSPEHPLMVRLWREGATIVMVNGRRPRAFGGSGLGLGLANLTERCRAATGRDALVEAGDESFRVELPVKALGEAC